MVTKREIKNNNTYLNKNNIKLIKIIIIFIIIHFSFERQKIFLKLNKINEIKMTLQGDGEKYVVYKNAYTLPDQIYVNGELVATSVNKVYLIKKENAIILKWNSPIDNCAKLFFNLVNIIKIDLSKFDTSKVTEMGEMFRNCSSLTSIIFNNMNTSSVTSMENLFNECKSLISLDLSGFNTSSVTTMKNMFKNSINLREVNVKNFNTSSVTNM